MNKSLAIVKARTVCGIHRQSGFSDWYVKCPSNLADMNSEPTYHVCKEGYNEATQWCAQAVARVALNLVKPGLNDGERRTAYIRMRNNQLKGISSSAQEILRDGLRHIEDKLV